MILLVSCFAKAKDCADEIERQQHEKVEVCHDLTRAISLLQEHDYSAVIVDELILDANSTSGETLFKHFGLAVPVFVNFAIAGIPRTMGLLQFALSRRSRELTEIRRKAGQDLRHQLNDTVTALLLSCEMALRVPDVPEPALCKMHSVELLAKQISSELNAEI